MAFGGFDVIRALDQIRQGGDRIHSEFLRRDRALEEIRADLHLSGTYVRDHLLEPEPASAEVHRKSRLVHLLLPETGYSQSSVNEVSL